MIIITADLISHTNELIGCPFRVSQSVEWNDMSSRKLSSLFAPILLRPNPQHIT